MYQIGDQVVYGIHGVCRVVNLEERSVDGKQAVFLVLEPEGQEGARYLIPTHNAVAMSKLLRMLSKEALDDLLISEQVHTDGWISDEKQRKQAYRELISSSDRARLMQMVCTLYKRKVIQNASGKKMHLCDDNFLRDAEKLLAGEIMAVFHMDSKSALGYLKEKLKEDA